MRAKSLRGHALFVLVGLLLVFGAPSLLSDFRLSLLAKYLCFAILAIGVDLSWGYGGMLVLGQGVFFGLGGYCMGMYLKLKAAGPGQLPDFMTWSGVDKLPPLWKPFQYAWFALPMAVLLPMFMGWILGRFIFRSRVRGAYFAILTQALAIAFVTLLVGQQGLTGGTNGLTNIRELLGLNLRDSGDRRVLYFIVVGVLGVVFIIARHLVNSRYGRLLIAVRDGEDRVRFLGYDPTKAKTSAFAISAGMAGLAGALFVPVVGIISPALLGVVPSIEMVIWVAVGGRATIYGAVLGAVVVNWAKTNLSERYPSGWLYFQGALFVIVMMFAPRGIAGLRSTVGGTVAHLRARFDWRDHTSNTPPTATEVIDRAEIVA